jgi:hypothetical protein
MMQAQEDPEGASQAVTGRLVPLSLERVFVQLERDSKELRELIERLTRQLQEGA